MFSSRLWQLFLDSFPKILLPGLTATIPLTIISFSLALVIAVVAALMQFANIQGLKQIARFYIWIFRGTPLLVQLFVVFFGLSRVGIVLDPFPAAVIVFSLNEGAYCAETIRAALESVAVSPFFDVSFRISGSLDLLGAGKVKPFLFQQLPAFPASTV